MSAALPTPIDCCGLQNCSSSSSGGGGGTGNATWTYANLGGAAPADLPPGSTDQSLFDLDTNAWWVWNGVSWQAVIGP